MPDAPLASVIILGYWGRDFVDDCLSSVLDQDLPPGQYEVLYIDNGSRDRAGELVRERYPRARVLTLERNHGYAEGNNIGFRNTTGSVAVYERIDDTGKAQVYVLFAGQPRVTAGGPGAEPLAGTPLVVGSDADPDFSPDGRLAVFRRLTGTTDPGRGAWDVMIVNLTDGSLTTVASGPAHRGAPDWGPQGIVFAEAEAGGERRLVMVQPDGSGRRVLLTVGSSFDLSSPRWLPQP